MKEKDTCFLSFSVLTKTISLNTEYEREKTITKVAQYLFVLFVSHLLIFILYLATSSFLLLEITLSLPGHVRA